MIDWTSRDSVWKIDPRLKEGVDLRHARRRAPRLSGHVWLATSGTSRSDGSTTFVALSKEALLASAAAVNRHLAATARDLWFLCLPTFHVGGLGIEARAFLAGQKVIRRDWRQWDPREVCAHLQRSRATLVSLVPTQVYDLVRSELTAPRDLRAAVIGGGALEDSLYRRARALGWPLLPSYGMTETCSQIATADLDSLRDNRPPCLKILDHVEVRTNKQDLLMVRGPCLLTGRWLSTADGGVWEERPTDGWWTTQDRVRRIGNELIFLGRFGRTVKVFGELVDLDVLERTLRAELDEGVDVRLIPRPHPRSGHEVVAVFEGGDWIRVRRAVNRWARSRRSFEVPAALFYVGRFPRTALGKVRVGQLENRLFR
jgi:O-succinylbenzoic acid--CoA ligase